MTDDAPPDAKVKKTWKREVGLTVLILYVAANAYVIRSLVEAQQWDLLVDLLKGQALPVMGLAGAVYGMDWWGKRANPESAYAE